MILLLLIIMAEQGPKVGDARSLWNFTPSPGAFFVLLLLLFFFLFFVFSFSFKTGDDDWIFENHFEIAAQALSR